MKRWILIAAFCVIPVAVFSHPGKTDKYGGHKCIKGCEDWGLLYGEYHLHDKYGKPIHVNRNKKSSEAPEMRSAATETAAPLVTTTTQTITVYRTITTVQGENIFALDPLLWVMLVLLLLLLILRRTRREPQKQ